MSSARSVDFIFELIDRFSPVAAKLAQAAKNAEKTIAGMGQATTKVEAGQRGAAAAIQAMNQRALAADPALRAATQRMLAFGSAGERAASQVRNLTQAHAALGKLEKEAALRNKYTGSVPVTGKAARSSSTHDMMNAYFGLQMIAQAQQGVSNFLDIANEQLFAKQKMAFIGFKGDLTGKADATADQLTGKYRNLSKGQIQEQLYEGVSIFGTAEHSLENAEIFAKFSSFLQSFQGGKHAGSNIQFMREAYSGIKSMEMQGTLNEMNPEKKKMEVEKYLNAMLSMKALYGENAKLSEYQGVQKLSGAAFYNMSDHFRFETLPAMIQERGISVGNRLMTTFNTMNGAVQLKGLQKEALSKFGFLEGKGKHAHISEALRKAYNYDPVIAAKMIEDQVAKVTGIDRSTPEGEAKFKDALTTSLAKMFPNRSMSGLFTDLIFNDKNFEKHAERMKKTRAELEAVGNGEFFFAKTKVGSEASVTAQWHNLLAAIGGPMLEPYIERMNNIAGVFNRMGEAVSNFSKSNPNLSKSIGQGAVGALGLLSVAAGLAGAGFLYAGLRTGLGFIGLGGGARMALAAAPMMAGYGGMALAGGAATAVTAGAVVARTGIMTRVLGGMVSALTLGAFGIGKFHMAANGMGAGLAMAGRVLRTTLVGSALALAFMNRDKIGDVVKYVTTAVQDLLGVFKAIDKHRLGSNERKAATKRLVEDVMGVDLTKITVPDVLGAPAALMEKARTSMRDSGYMSYLRYQVYDDQFRMPYGERPELSRMVNKMGGQGRIAGDNASDFMDDHQKYLKNLDPMNMNAFGGYPSAPIPQTTGAGNAAYFMPPEMQIAAPASERDREISVRSFVDVTVPPSIPIQVTVSGTVNGTVTGAGQGAINMKASAPRGESSPVPQQGAGFDF